MTCEDLLLLFSQYLDHDLAPAHCAELERHASECARCSEFLGSVKRTVTLCRELKTGESPRPLSAEARARLRGLYERNLAARKRR